MRALSTASWREWWVVETQILASQRSEQSKGSEVRAKSALSPGMCCVKALALWRWQRLDRIGQGGTFLSIINTLYTQEYIWKNSLAPLCLALAPLHIETECKEDESVCANFLPTRLAIGSQLPRLTAERLICTCIYFSNATHLFLGSQSAH